MERLVRYFCVVAAALLAHRAPAAGSVDFQREIRPILSQNCFLCHGPDENERKGGLRLDVRDDALKPAKSGERAIIPGEPEKSAIITRITHSDPDEQMPPSKSGKKLSTSEIEQLRKWIADGAPYANHWSYVKPERPALPKVKRTDWVRNGIDHFILRRLEQEALEPTSEADRRALIRRVSLDLTGLPPTPVEVQAFLADTTSAAYESLVDRLLDRPAFGEHWARMWLDLARYADSAGYADDPLRTIWGYRDYVIDAFNKNKPFDRFTLEQIAGDLLPNPSEEQLIATAFHRNTMTNNEGGTNDEEFRSAAIVDRVNTTMAVWMGTSIGCAQCHTHKYDPITQDEYFQFYAILDNTEDADRPDESPTLKVFTSAQKKQRTAWESEIAALDKKLLTPTPELQTAADKWQADFPREVQWQTLKTSKGSLKQEITTVSDEDGLVRIGNASASEVYSLEFPIEDNALTGLKLEVVGDTASGGGRVTRVSASIIPPKLTVGGRYVRIEIPGKNKILSLAEVQVFSGKENIAPSGEASQSTTELGAEAKLAIDNNTEGNFSDKSVTHTANSENPWWELDLKAIHELSRIVVWNRTDNGTQKRLADFRVSILNGQRETLWERDIKDAPNPNLALAVDATRILRFAGAYSNSSVESSNPADVLKDKADPNKGWLSGEAGTLVLMLEKPVRPDSGSRLSLTIERSSTLQQTASFRLAVTGDADLPKYASTPPTVLAALAGGSKASDEQKTKLTEYYLRQIAPDLQPERDQIATLTKSLEQMKPYSVPVMRELAGDKRRKTRFQYRGNFMDLGKEVTEGVPSAFHPLPKGQTPDRLVLAKWLVDENNPLTARVMANRFWEEIFGIGLVRTTEEFGAQGEGPSHPELLDWLATEFMAQRWDVKRFLKMLVTSATYRQSSRVTPELAERDPENRLLARGPRFRLPAEAVRDQALFAGGLLSGKAKGPSVRPLRPSSGLSAAFGSSVDWKPSEGEDRFRRALYTEWRRTSPYPSMTTFDAPNREVCTIRRNRTNTPLQALVTLNDPVYIEAAQGLARRMMENGGSVADCVRHGFELCLARQPGQKEVNRLAVLFGEALTEYAQSPEKSAKMSGTSVGDSPELSAWTVVANVLLNLDETLMKR